MTTSTALSTGPTAAELACIPEALKARPQWVLWRGADRINAHTGEVKLNKIPIDAQTLTRASSTDAETWHSLRQCRAALPCALEEWGQEARPDFRGGGLGYVFAHEDPFCGIDLDGCRHPMTGDITAWAQNVLDTLTTYTEVSPSGTGVKLWVRGTLPPGRRKTGRIEMYDEARFFTVTGWRVPGAPATIAARQDALEALHRATFGTAADTRNTPHGTTCLSKSVPQCRMPCCSPPSVRVSNTTNSTPSGTARGPPATRVRAKRTWPFWRSLPSGRKTPPNWNASSVSPGWCETNGASGPTTATGPSGPRSCRQQPSITPNLRSRLQIPVDTWLGPRSTWCGVPAHGGR